MNFLKASYRKLKEYIITAPPALKASIAYMAVNFMQKGVSFLTSPIFTRVLSTADYGKVSVYTSWVEILGIFAMFNVYDSVYNNGYLEYQDDRENLTFSMLRFSNLMTCLTFLVVWFVNRYVFRFLQISDALILFMFFCFLFEPAFEFWKTQQRFQYHYKAACIYAILVMIGSPVFALSGIFLFPDSKVEARIIGAQLVTIVIEICCYALEWFRSNKKVNFQYWKYTFTFNLPLFPYMISTFILNCSDRIMISYMVSDSAAGVYSIAYTAAAIVGIVWNSIISAMTPLIYQRCHEDRMDTLSDILMPLQTFFGIICVTVMALAPEVIRFLAPSSYGEGVYAVPAIIAGTFFNTGYTIFSAPIIARKKQKYVTYMGIGTSVLNIVLNFLLIPRFGYLAAGYTTLVSYFVQYIGTYMILPNILGERIYRKDRITLNSALVVISAVVFPLIYRWIWIRYLLLVVLFYMIWKNRNVLLRLRYRDFS
ncbi:MAG: oligosaccharide flippase family protein [Lachnospiraceae bacterium]|nr:oligosaccharide flippase family protein [Lachnospiraceae bacterium]